MLLEPIRKEMFGILDRILVPEFSGKQMAMAGQPWPHPVPDEALGEWVNQKGVLESPPGARGSVGSGLSCLMQEVGMVLSRNRKLSPGRDSSEDLETRKERKQV